MGFVFGGEIANQAVRQGASPARATLCIWVVVLAAGYLPNCAYTLYLLNRNGSAAAFRKRTFIETLLAAAAACLWLFGMLGYGVGASIMGPYGNSVGFAVCMIALLLWASALGVFSGEWRAAPSSARLRMYCGVGLITISVLSLGLGTLLYEH
jgi:L-rhamnose-H+ transport protein